MLSDLVPSALRFQPQSLFHHWFLPWPCVCRSPSLCGAGRSEPGRRRDPGQLLISGHQRFAAPYQPQPWAPYLRAAAEDEGSQGPPLWRALCWAERGGEGGIRGGCSSAVDASPATSRKVSRLVSGVPFLLYCSFGLGLGCLVFGIGDLRLFRVLN